MHDNQRNNVRHVRIIYILEVVLRWRTTILFVMVASLLIGVLLAFLVSREYKSVVRVLPPKESSMLSGLSGLSSLVRNLPIGLSKFGSVEDPFDYVAILRSRTVLEALVREFDLIAVYGISDSSMEKTVKALKQNTEIDWTEEGTLELRVWDEGSRRAADIANSYVAHLNKRSYDLQTQEARNTRTFIEQRLNENRADLHKAEEKLREYQEKHGMIFSGEPTAGSLSAIGELYALKARKEIELSILEKTVGEANPQYKQILLEVQSIRSKISKFPEIGIESLRLLREVLIQQKIMEMVVPLYEQAKVNENKDVPVAYVLDPAIPGERPDRPKRLFIVGIATFLGIMVSLVLVTYREYETNLRVTNPEEWLKLRTLGSLLVSKKR